ncbi:TatD family hydrolase [Pseudoalteromonas sp. T1lg65]|uniref:TatD family hydrolase n=1 Tax=Pseudoalteromonas sp. T1lg65 TaxID=2077101 RepID=UPI003F7A6431
MQFIDSHCHLDFDELREQLSEHLAAAKLAGVEHFVVPGVTFKQSQALLGFAKSHSSCSIAAGLHPYFIEQHEQQHIARLATLIKDNPSRFCAIGECGIDATCGQLTWQIELFKAHVELSNQFALPLIVHHRKSHHLIAQVFKQVRPKFGGVIHAFSGSFQQAQYYIELGFKLGVGGTITYPRGAKTAEVFSQLPLDSLVLETDAPSMPVFGYQGKPNTPAHIATIFEVLCDNRIESKEEIEQVIFATTINLFNL